MSRPADSHLQLPPYERLRVRLQIQLHKILWDPSARGV